MPLITVGVTVYNLEKYIAQCLDSILCQDFDDYELIVVDNGSSDSSIEICEKYAKNYPNKIKFTKLPQPTVLARSYQEAVKQAKGEYIHMVDGDDYVAEGYLKNISKIIKSKEPDLIFGSFKTIVEDGATGFNDAIFDQKMINDVPYIDAIKYLVSLPNFHNVGWRYIFKREKVFGNRKVKVPKQSDGIYQFGEAATMLCWFLESDSIHYYDGPFYYYRRRTNGCVTAGMYNRTTYDFMGSLINLHISLEHNIRRNLGEDGVEIAKYVSHNYIKLFLGGADNISSCEFANLSSLIERNLKPFYFMKKYKSKYFSNLIDFVKKYGSFTGLLMYCEWDRVNLLNKFRDYKNEDIFVFPTGIYGEGTARLLKRYGINITGFLDNDKTKSNLLFNNWECYLPSVLLQLDHEKRKSVKVVIATIYDRLIPTLKKQLTDMGIDEDNIIIRE